MKTNDFSYFLPPDQIAQTPVEPRHASRLLVFYRTLPNLQHTTFWHVADFLQPGDLLVINQTKVIPARIFGRKSTGGKVELLLLKRIDLTTWEALVGGKNVREGAKIFLEGGPIAEILPGLDGARRFVRFNEPVEEYLAKAGQMPLPPYIHERLSDPDRYQTVYAREAGSAAAPTAGLHFTPELMEYLESRGIRFARVTLHVGLDTFAPVTEDNPQDHKIHTEWCELDTESASLVNQTKKDGKRVIAVGTTSVRVLETAGRNPQAGDIVGTYSGPTDLFIIPGYSFRVIDGLITNFHLPKSTLLMMISAFAGRERILEVYAEAIRKNYRFYSFGDAMFIL